MDKGYRVKDYPYRQVPNSWRNRIKNDGDGRRHGRRRMPRPIEDPLITDLMAGKTILVDYSVPLDRQGQMNNPFRNLYNFFKLRDKYLQMHVVDDVDTNQFRRLLMWLEEGDNAW